MAEARDNFDKAIGWNTENPDNYFNLGNVLLNDEKFAEAHENFDTAISKDSKNAKFYYAKMNSGRRLREIQIAVCA